MYPAYYIHSLRTSRNPAGPAGASIRNVSQTSGTAIRSWNETYHSEGKPRKIRRIVLEGSHESVITAVSILSEAVDRYKDLCEGKYCGKPVDRVQVIRGVEFYYSPPPRSAVPYAAPLKPESPLPLSTRPSHLQQNQPRHYSTQGRPSCHGTMPQTDDVPSCWAASGENQRDLRLLLSDPTKNISSSISPASVIGINCLHADTKEQNLATAKGSRMSTPGGTQDPESLERTPLSRAPMNVTSDIQNMMDQSSVTKPAFDNNEVARMGDNENWECSSPYQERFGHSVQHGTDSTLSRHDHGIFGSKPDETLFSTPNPMSQRFTPTRGIVGAVSGHSGVPTDNLGAMKAAAVQSMALHDHLDDIKDGKIDAHHDPTTPFTNNNGVSRSLRSSPVMFENQTAKSMMASALNMLGTRDTNQPESSTFPGVRNVTETHEAIDALSSELGDYKLFSNDKQGELLSLLSIAR